MRNVLVSFAACALIGAAAFAGAADSPAPVADDAAPDAEITLQGQSVAAGIGFTWGRGEITYQNGSHTFSIKGVSVIDVGVSKFSAKGVVYNLKDLADFEGDYGALGAGVAIAGGGTAVYLQNEQGVVIKLISRDVGVKFKLSADGVQVQMKS